MVNKKNILISVLVLIVGIGAAIYFFPSEEKRIKKQFSSLSEWISKEPDEKKLTMATKRQNIMSVFAKTCKFEAPAAEVSGTHSPDEIATKAIMARSRFATLSLKFYDLEVDFPQEGMAKVIATAKLTGSATDGEAIEETHEIECVLQKTEGDWLISEVEVVEVLKK